MYLSPLERLQLLLINFPETFSPSAPTPLAHAIIYLHCVFPHRPPSTPPLCPLPPPPHLTPNLPVSPVAAHACRRWDIAFLILLTGANIYVLFFDIHCSSSRRTVGPSRDTRSPTLKKNKQKKTQAAALPLSISAPHSFSIAGKPATLVVIWLSLRANRGRERRGQLGR